MSERPKSSDFYFSPDSKLWEISRERASLLGTQRTILMQLAHPLITQAISEHSNFKEDPLRRLTHTRTLISSLIFGTREDVLAAARTINNAHKSVKGDLKQDNGMYKAGTAYNAKSPELTMWTWATLIDTRIVVYDKFVRPLAHDEKEQFYEESKGILPLLGGKPQEAPSSAHDFSDYMKDIVHEGKVVVGPEARQLAPYILLKQFPPAKPLALFMSTIAIGLLPETIRNQYGFSWNPIKQTILDTTASVSRLAYQHILPDKIRFSSGYRNALKK